MYVYIYIYIYIYIYVLIFIFICIFIFIFVFIFIWRFPEIGVPPNHPFLDGIFHEISHPIWGTPILGTPHMDGEKCWVYHMFRQVKGVKPSSVQAAHVNENPSTWMDLLDVQPNRKPPETQLECIWSILGFPPKKGHWLWWRLVPGGVTLLQGAREGDGGWVQFRHGKPCRVSDIPVNAAGRVWLLSMFRFLIACFGPSYTFIIIMFNPNVMGFVPLRPRFSIYSVYRKYLALSAKVSLMSGN